MSDKNDVRHPFGPVAPAADETVPVFGKVPTVAEDQGEAADGATSASEKSGGSEDAAKPEASPETGKTASTTKKAAAKKSK